MGSFSVFLISVENMCISLYFLYLNMWFVNVKYVYQKQCNQMYNDLLLPFYKISRLVFCEKWTKKKHGIHFFNDVLRGKISFLIVRSVLFFQVTFCMSESVLASIVLCCDLINKYWIIIVPKWSNIWNDFPGKMVLLGLVDNNVSIFSVYGVHCAAIGTWVNLHHPRRMFDEWWGLGWHHRTGRMECCYECGNLWLFTTSRCQPLFDLAHFDD